MLKFVVQCPQRTYLPVSDTANFFPVRRVYCVGRNYGDHAIEMGHNPDKEAPFFFQKNPDNLDPSGEFPYPPFSSNVQYEVELAILLKAGGNNIDLDLALEKIYGYAVCLDMTRRDLQTAQKKLGRPWEIGKAFERSAPIGPVIPIEKTGHLSEGTISLKVNGTLKQKGNLNQMIWKIPEIISYLSNYFELATGDIILSGTPAGVGSVAIGDVIEAYVQKVGSLQVIVK